jgi:hypothetical protein
MAKGWFFDAAGVPLYFGEAADKPALSGNTFVAEARAGPRPSDLHGWDGQGWALNATLSARAARRDAEDALARLDRDVPRALEDLIDALVARGVIAKDDLPAATAAKIAAKQAERAKPG